MPAPNTNQVYQTNAKRLLLTTSSNADLALPNFTASEAREFGGILGVSYTETPSVVNTSAGRLKERNRRGVITLRLLQAGRDTISHVEDTLQNKANKIFIGVEGTDNNNYLTSESFFLREELEIDLSSEGDSEYRLIGESVRKQGKDLFLTPDASDQIGPTNPTKLIQLSEEIHGPVCEVSMSQTSGSNWTGSGYITSDDAMISWIGKAVETEKGQMLPRDGRGTVKFKMLQTNTSSIDSIEDTFRDNVAHFSFKYEDSDGVIQEISTAESGGMNLTIERQAEFVQDNSSPQTILITGEVVTPSILTCFNLPT